MEIPASDSLKDLLVRQGLRGSRLASGRANGMASAPVRGEEERATRHSPTVGKGDAEPMGISGKEPGMFQPGQVQQGGNSDKQTSGRRLGQFAYEVHTNPVMLNTSMRKTAQRRTSAAFLRLVK